MLELSMIRLGSIKHTFLEENLGLGVRSGHPAV